MASQIDEDQVVSVDDKNGLYIEKYNEWYGLYGLQKGSNDVWYKIWVYISEWSKGAGDWVAGKKKRPMAVRLGTKPEAVKALKQLLRQIEEG